MKFRGRGLSRRPIAVAVALTTAVATLTGIAAQLNPAKAASAGPGSADETFESGAKDLFVSSNEHVHGSAIGFNNRPVLAMYTTQAQTRTWVVRRTSNNHDDTSFSGDGKAFVDLTSLTYPNGVASSTNPVDIAIDYANRPVVVTNVGTSTGRLYYVVTRFTDTGALDTSFGTGGSIVGDFGDVGSLATSVALDDLNGVIYVAGSSRNGSSVDHAAIRRIAYDGNYFTGTQPSFPGPFASGYSDVEIDFGHGNKPIAVGWVQGATGMPGDDTFDPIINRFNTDGTYDSAYAPFAGNGRIPLYTSNQGEQALGLGVEYSGNGVAFAVHDFTTGQSTDLVYRLDGNGDMDSSWSVNPANLGLSSQMPIATKFDGTDTVVVAGDDYTVSGSPNFITRLGSDGNVDSSYQGWNNPYGSSNSGPLSLNIDRAQRAVVAADQAGVLTDVSRFTADRADGPSLPNKFLVDETTANGERSIYGMSPDARDLVAMEDGGAGFSYERPTATQSGMLLFEKHDTANGMSQVMQANAADGGNVYPLNQIRLLPDDGYNSYRPTISNGDGTIMFLAENTAQPERGKCIYYTVDYDPDGTFGGLDPDRGCNVTDAAVNPYLQDSLAFIRNGDIYLSDKSGYDQDILVAGAQATRVEWGNDGQMLMWDDNSGATHKLNYMALTYDQAINHQVGDGPHTVVSTGSTITSFALEPELGTDTPIVYTYQDSNGTQLDVASLDGTTHLALMRGANLRVGAWSRNLSIYPPGGPNSAISPSSVSVDQLPIAPHSPQAQDQVNAGNKAASGLLNLKILNSPILNLKILNSPILNLKILNSGLLNLKILSSPVGVAPLGLASDLGGSPRVREGLERINLQQIQLTSGATWQQRLSAPGMSDEAVRLSKEPLQNVSLFDVLQLSPQIEFPTLAEMDLSEGPLGQIPVLVLLLGDTRLSQIGGIDWCGVFEVRGSADCGAEYGVPGSALKGRSASLLSLHIAGFNLDDLPRTDGKDNDLRSITYDQVNFDPARSLLPNIIIGSDGHVDTYKASVGSAKIAQATPSRNAVAYCTDDTTAPPAGVTPIDCAGDATVHTARMSGGLRRDATVGDLGDALRGYPLNELALGVWGDPGDDPYDRPPSALGVNPTMDQDAGQRFSLNYTRLATGQGQTVSPTILVELPAGYEYVAGTTYFTNSGDGIRAQLNDPDINGQGRFLRWTVPTVLDGGFDLNLEFKASPTANVSGQLVATIDDGFLSQQVGSEELHAIDANEADNPDDAPEILADHLYFGRLDSSTDVDYFNIPLNAFEGQTIRPGSTINVYLSQLRYDADLTVYHPADSARGEPLRDASADLVDINSVGDKAPEVINKGEAIGDAADYDVPLLGTLPVAGISDNRGTKAEKVTSFTWPESIDIDDQDNPAAHRYVVQVSGFNGAHGPETYAVRYTVTDPSVQTNGTARPASFHTGSSPAPAALTANVDTLILTNPTRLAALYPGRESVVANALPQLAADTNGVVFPVDSDPDVNAAYATWDDRPGDVEAANAVVRAINAAVDNFLGSHRSALKSMIVVGTDEVIPMARLQDLTAFANERTFAQDLRQLAGNTGGNNALYSAAVGGKILSDDPYGAFTPRRFDGEWLYVPDVAMGRLVETPENIADQINEFHTPAQAGDPVGSIRPTSTLSVGADFMTRMADKIQSTFNQPLFGGTHDSLISQSWTRSDLSNKVGANAPSIAAINTHYSPFELAPGSRLDAAHPDNPNLTAAELTTDADFRRRLLFTMGCHSGFSITDYLGSTAPDFAQALSAESASGFIGNTGFGLGVREYDAFSQKLFANFASLLTQYNFGTALQQAKQQYLSGGVTSPYDYKVLAEATYFGIPQYKVVGATPVVPAPNDAPVNDPAFGGTKAASVVKTQPISSAWARQDTDTGSVFDLTTPDSDHAVVQDRPVQPSRKEDVTASNPNLRAAGAFIDQLEIGATDPNFDPVLARPQVASGATNAPEVKPDSLISPARLADIAHFVDGNGRPRQSLVVVPAQFASTGKSSAGDLLGTETRFSKVGVKVLFQDITSPDYAGDRTEPVVSNGKFVYDFGTTNTNVSLTAFDAESDIVRVVALWRKNSETAYHLLDLTPDADDPTQFNGVIQGNGNSLQGFFEVVNSDGLVQIFQDKGASFTPIIDRVDVSYDRTPTSRTGNDATFAGPVTVHLTEVGPEDPSLLMISINGGPEQSYKDNDVPLTDDGTYEIHYRSTNADLEGDFTVVIEQPATPDAVAVTYSRPMVNGVFPGPVTVHLNETPEYSGITSVVTFPNGTTDTVGGPDITLSNPGTYTIAYETGLGTTGSVILTIQPATPDAVQVVPSDTPRNDDGAYLGPVVLQLNETPVSYDILVTITKNGVAGVPGYYSGNRVPLSAVGHYVVHYKTYVGTEGDYTLDIVQPPVVENVTVAYDTPANGNLIHTAATNATVVSNVPDSVITVKVNGQPTANPVRLGDPAMPATAPDGTYTISWTTSYNSSGSEQVLVDTNAPSVAITSPANHSTFLLNQSVTPTANCLDVFLLTTNGCAKPALDTSTVTNGVDERTFTVTGTDLGDHQTQVSRGFSVVFAPSGPCGALPSHSISPKSAKVGLLQQVNVAFNVCDANGVPYTSTANPPVYAPPLEIDGNGAITGTALGGCQALLGLIPLCVIQPRQTAWSVNSSGLWTFRQDTLLLTLGVHKFRVFLTDGSYMDYTLQKVLLK